MFIIRVQKSEHRLTGKLFGKGLFATRTVRAGEALFTLDGPIITFTEASAMGDEQSYALQCGQNSYISLTEPARFINHSCDPNAGIRRHTMVAIRSIAENEEVTFDYSTTMDEQYWTMVCHCKTPLCRGIVDDFRTLATDVQRRYLNLGIVMPFIASKFDPSKNRQ